MNVPPPMSNYPRAGAGGNNPNYKIPTKHPGVYFDYIGTAFEMIKVNLGVFVVASLLTLVGGMAVSFGGSTISNIVAYGTPLPGAKADPLNMTALILSLAIGILSAFIYNGLISGMGLIALEYADTGVARVETMFQGFKNMGGLFVASVLFTLALYVGFAACIVPGIYLMGALAFATYLPAFEGLSGMDSLKKSFALLKPHAWSMFALVLVGGFISGLGVLLCCVGLLFTLPLVPILIALHYRNFRDHGAQAQNSPF